METNAMMIPRRRLLHAAALGAAWGATSPAIAAPAARKLTIGVGGFTFAYLPLFVANAAGFLGEEGLQIELIQTGSGATAMAAMLGGSFDICGLVLSDVILAATKGQHMSVFAPLMTQYASDAIISKAAAERVGLQAGMPLIERIKRLKGLTLAVSGRGSGIDKMWRYLFKLAGMNADTDVTLTVIKLDQMYPALRAGQIDGYNTTAPANNRAVDEGLAVWVARPSQGEVPGLQGFVYTILAAKPAALQTHRAELTTLARGLARANILINDDPARAADAVHQTPWAQTDLSLLQHAISDQRTAFARRMTLTPQIVEQNKDFMAGYGDDVKSVGYKDIIDPSVIDALT
jgi:NitT/TauT family transport system substrate-binding protein